MDTVVKETAVNNAIPLQVTMLPIETIISFMAASFLLALAPGPDNIFVLTQSALSGKSAGLIIMLGLFTGVIGHTLAVTFGVALIFKTSTVAFTILKCAGAAYLLYLAWQAFHAPVINRIEKGIRQTPQYLRLYRRGVIMNITNPKVALFFLAFLPQFADPERGPVGLQLILLGCLFVLAAMPVFATIAILAGTLGQWLNRSDRVQKRLNQTAALIFFALAVKLVTAVR